MDENKKGVCKMCKYAIIGMVEVKDQKQLKTVRAVLAKDSVGCNYKRTRVASYKSSLWGKDTNDRNSSITRRAKLHS